MSGKAVVKQPGSMPDVLFGHHIFSMLSLLALMNYLPAIVMPRAHTIFPGAEFSASNARLNLPQRQQHNEEAVVYSSPAPVKPS
jgi:hypothetical protein